MITYVQAAILNPAHPYLHVAVLPYFLIQTQEESVRIGKCAAENGLARALWYFSKQPN